MNFKKQVCSRYILAKEKSYQYYVDFRGYKGKQKNGYKQWEFTKTQLKDILSKWDKKDEQNLDYVVWLQAGEARKDTTFALRLDKPSTPLGHYLEKNPEDKKTNCLYHGVGKDFKGQSDLKNLYMDVDIYDPFFKDFSKEDLEKIQKTLKLPVNSEETRTPPEKRENDKPKEYGHIHSHYTLNVVPKQVGRGIIQHFHDLMSKDGVAIVSVRRDTLITDKVDKDLLLKYKQN